MIATQFTVAFTEPISVRELYEILAKHYGSATVEQGQGIFVNGLPTDWIVVHKDERP